MLLTKEQCQLLSKYLEPIGEEKYRYIGKGKISKYDKEKLLEFDELSLLCCGNHAIVNYGDIS